MEYKSVFQAETQVKSFSIESPPCSTLFISGQHTSQTQNGPPGLAQYGSAHCDAAWTGAFPMLAWYSSHFFSHIAASSSHILPLYPSYRQSSLSAPSPGT